MWSFVVWSLARAANGKRRRWRRPYFQRSKDYRRLQVKAYRRRLDYLVDKRYITQQQAHERFHGYVDAQRQRKRFIQRGVRNAP